LFFDRQWSAHTSLRRAPVVMVVHTNAPHSGSCADSSMIRAASSGVGGCGSDCGMGVARRVRWD
jgi:hypothetical protein